MEINTQSVDAYHELLTNPQKHGLPFRPITECFIKSDKVTAKHILAKEFLDDFGRDLPKIFLYIVMDKVFGQCNGKDEKGDLGYHLSFVKPKTDKA